MTDTDACDCERECICPARVRAETLPATGTLTHAELTHALALCQEALGADGGSPLGGALGRLRDLLAGRPGPRVWLEGDLVPAGVAVIDEHGCEDGEFWLPLGMPQRFDRPVMEIRPPAPADLAAVVAAEQARRSADELTVHDQAAGYYDVEIPPCRCGRHQPCRHCPTDGEATE